MTIWQPTPFVICIMQLLIQHLNQQTLQRIPSYLKASKVYVGLVRNSHVNVIKVYHCVQFGWVEQQHID